MSKTNINRFGLKFVMLLVFALCGKVAMAQNAVSVEAFTIDSYSTYDVPVLLSNDEPVYSVLFDVVLPAELQLAGKPYMDNDRCNVQYQSMSWNENNGRVMINSQPFQPIAGTEGAVAYIPVKLAFGANVNTTYTFGLKNIEIVGANGKTISWGTKDEATVTAVPGIVKGYATAAEVVVNPGETFELPFAFTNTCNVAGFQVKATVPEGFTIDAQATPADRVVAGTNIAVNAQTGIIVVSNLGNNQVVNGNDGVVFTLSLTAPENWDGTGVVTFTDLQVSYIAGKFFDGTGYTVNLVNGGTAYTKAKAEIDALQAALDAAVAQVAEKYPAVADQVNGEAIQAQIDALKAAVDAAYADHTLSTAYDTIMAPVADINAAIAALDAQAQEAQRKYDNAQAYAEYNAMLEAAQEMLDEAKATVTESYPTADVAAEIAAAQDAINESRQALEAAKQACENEGDFKFDFYMGGIEALINKIVPEAKRQSENEAAAAEYGAMIEYLQTALDEAKATVAENYADADVKALVDAAQALVDQAKADFDAAKEACANEGSFKFDFNMMPIENAINAIVPEAKRQSDNNAAYAEMSYMVQAAQEMLEEAKKNVADTYPGADVTAEVAAAQALIDAAKKDIEAAKEACATEGNFSYAFDFGAIEAAINAIEAKAKFQADVQSKYDAAVSALDALQTKLDTTKETVAGLYTDVNIEEVAAAAQEAITKAYTDAQAALEAAATAGEFNYTVPTADIEALIAAIAPEAKRQSENAKAYEADKATIAALEEELKNTLDEVTTKYPSAAVLTETLAAQNAIADATKAVEEAYAAVAEEGNYTSPVDAEAIKALIEKILLVASGINEVLVEELGGDVKLYNLSGIQVKNPAAGTVVIAVGANGQVRKLIVK